MKKIIMFLLCVCLCAGTGLWAFEKGTFTVGGSAGYRHEKISISNYKFNTHQVNLSPYGGYFVADNLCLDLMLRYNVSWENNDDPSRPGFGIGIGARYFVKRFYGGVALNLDSWRQSEKVFSGNKLLDKNTWWSGKNATLKVGYMLPLLKNVYADFGAFYRIGLGKYTNSIDSDDNYDNDGKEFGTTIGIAFFVK